jgi:hypothetical protein
MAIQRTTVRLPADVKLTLTIHEEMTGVPMNRTMSRAIGIALGVWEEGLNQKDKRELRERRKSAGVHTAPTGKPRRR